MAQDDDVTAEREPAGAVAAIRRASRPRNEPVEWFAPLAALHARLGETDTAKAVLRDGLIFADRLGLSADHFLRGRLLLDLAELEHSSGEIETARRYAVAAATAMAKELPDTHPWRRESDELLVALTGTDERR